MDQLFPTAFAGNWINYNHLGVVKQKAAKNGNFHPRTKMKQILIARQQQKTT